MYYSIYATDAKGTLQTRLKVRSEHKERLMRLVNQGRLIVAGPNPAVDSTDPGEAGFTGSVIIAQFTSLEEAKQWINQDPYVINGVYEKVEVKPFNIVLS